MRTLVGLLIGTLFAFSTASYAAEFMLVSSGFVDKAPLPDLYGCDGKNVSPPLKWSNPPKGTQAYALIFHSPDWSAGYVYLWVVYNIPKEITELKEDASRNWPNSDILMGTNYYHESVYRGPCPPDKLLHHYVFTLYALDAPLDLYEDADPQDVLKQIVKHLLGKAELSGQFKHKH